MIFSQKSQSSGCSVLPRHACTVRLFIKKKWGMNEANPNGEYNKASNSQFLNQISSKSNGLFACRVILQGTMRVTG